MVVKQQDGRRVAIVKHSSTLPTSRLWLLGWPAAALTALVFVLLTIGGLWELFLGGSHTRHLLIWFLIFSFLALGSLAANYTARRGAVAEIEAQTKATVDSAMDAIISVTEDQRIVLFNQAAEKMFRCPVSEVIGTSLDRFISPAFRSLHRAHMKRFAESGETSRRIDDLGTLYALRSDGEAFPIEASIAQAETHGKKLFTAVLRDVTERLRAEGALRESEERFRRVVDHIGDAVFVDDVEGHATFANDRFLNLFGFRREQLPSIRLEDLAAPEYRAEVCDRHNRRVRGESVATNFEYEGMRTDGTRMWLEVDVVPVTDQESKIIGTQSVLRDITERKRAQQAIQDSEQRLRHLIEASNDWVYEVDRTGAYTYAGPQCRDLLGYEPEELIGKRPTDFMPPNEPSSSVDAFQNLLAEPGPFSGLKTTRVRKDGKLVVWETNGVPFFDKNGGFCGYRGLVRDITERDRAEQALRESEERFRLVANSAPVMIWMSGTDKLCNYFNRPWLDFTGASLGSQLGDGWLKAVHTEDASTCLQTYVDAFDQRKPFEMQYRLRRHDSEYRWILDLGVPRFNSDGSFAGYIGSCIDITERKQAEEAMATIGRRLIEAHEEERTWIGRELHDDINQRLALLSVELDRWLKDNPSKAPVRDLVRRAQQRLTEVARDIQRLSHRLHSSKLEYLGLAKAAASFCREFAEQSNVEVTFRPDGIPRILSKEISLGLFRVLQEALQNAAKHSEVKSFTVDLRGLIDSIELTIADSGVGFDPTEAFARQGLGLISMRERLQLLHGELSILSKPGGGTTIHARVPIENSASQALAG